MCKTFLGIDPIEKPIPVYPTAHYTMGGIPTDINGQVVVPAKESPEKAISQVYMRRANRLVYQSMAQIV